jgi:hypothetical protein
MEYQASNRNFNTLAGKAVRNTYGNCVTQALATALGIPYKAAAGIILKHGKSSLAVDGNLESVQGIHTYREAVNIIRATGRPARIHTFTSTVHGRYFKGYFSGERGMQSVEDDEGTNIELVHHDKGCTTKTFPKRFKNGRFMVIRDRHAVASVYGELFDNNHNELVTRNKAVQFAIEFLPMA